MQFSLSRFKYLCKLQFATNRKLYLLGIAAMAGIMLCFMFLAAFTFDYGLTFETQVGFLTIGLVLSSAFFGSLIFQQYSEKNKRIQTILLPVSNEERLAVAILLTFLLFPLVFILLYFICITLVNAVDVHVLGNMNDIFIIDGIEGRYTMMAFFFIQSIALLGAASFRRFTFVKTIVMVCIATICISVANNFISKAILQRPVEKVATYAAKLKQQPFPADWIRGFDMNSPGPFQDLRFYGKDKYGYNLNGAGYWVALPDNQMILFMIFLGLIPLFFFYVTGVKLREQQL